MLDFTFTEEQYALVQKMKGQLGLSDSEVVRNIVLAWLAEKSPESKFVYKRAGRFLQMKKQVEALLELEKTDEYFLNTEPDICCVADTLDTHTHLLLMM